MAQIFLSITNTKLDCWGVVFELIYYTDEFWQPELIVYEQILGFDDSRVEKHASKDQSRPRDWLSFIITIYGWQIYGALWGEPCCVKSLVLVVI